MTRATRFEAWAAVHEKRSAKKRRKQMVEHNGFWMGIVLVCMVSQAHGIVEAETFFVTYSKHVSKIQFYFPA